MFMIPTSIYMLSNNNPLDWMFLNSSNVSCANVNKEKGIILSSSS